jgi:NAD(P) transhydrogenase subunit alpha
MLIGVPAETTVGNPRCDPRTAKGEGARPHLRIRSECRVSASVTDEAYTAVGAEITDAAGAYAWLVLKCGPSDDENHADQSRTTAWSACCE